MLVIASFKAVLPTCCQLLVLSKQLLHCPIYHCSSCSTLLLHFLLESQPVCDHISIFLQMWILSPLHSLLVGQFPSLIVEEAHDPWFFLWLFPSYQPHGFGECYPNPKPAEFIHLEVSIVMGVTPNERFTMEHLSIKGCFGSTPISGNLHLYMRILWNCIDNFHLIHQNWTKEQLKAISINRLGFRWGTVHPDPWDLALQASQHRRFWRILRDTEGIRRWS